MAKQIHTTIPTGRGSYILPGQISLKELLRRYDAAAPEHVTMPRDEVIRAFRPAEDDNRT